MRVLRRFPVSDEFISDRKTFCVILDRKQHFEISNNVFFYEWSRDPRRHGNVGNHLAHRMEAPSEACGTCFRSKLPSEELTGNKEVNCRNQLSVFSKTLFTGRDLIRVACYIRNFE